MPYDEVLVLLQLAPVTMGGVSSVAAFVAVASLADRSVF